MPLVGSGLDSGDGAVGADVSVLPPPPQAAAKHPAGTGVAMTAAVNKAMSRWKDMAPGTHVVNDSVPEAYGALTR